MRGVLRVGLLAMLLALVFAAGMVSAHEKTGPHKKLFGGRWYQQPLGGNYDAWMTLSTSRTWFMCDGNAANCASKWSGPSSGAYDEWNGRDTTARFEVLSDQNPEYDVNVYVLDTIADLPGILGATLTYDINGDICNFDACTYWYADIGVADDYHAGPYSTTSEREVTVAHELGHALSLAHESVNPGETVQYECGQDNTGAIPHSIMAYDCIDPLATGGAGETYVHDWDVCGVNHAYYDPSVGYAMCGSDAPTPTRTPTRTRTPRPTTPTRTPTRVPAGDGSGDVNDDGRVTSADALWVYWIVTRVVGQAPRPLGADVNQDGIINAIDAALILQFDAGLIDELPV